MGVFRKSRVSRSEKKAVKNYWQDYEFRLKRQMYIYSQQEVDQEVVQDMSVAIWQTHNQRPKDAFIVPDEAFSILEEAHPGSTDIIFDRMQAELDARAIAYQKEVTDKRNAKDIARNLGSVVLRPFE
jgi:hypothetical protein